MTNKEYKNLEEMLRSLKSVALSEAEKSSMRDNLINFMQSDVRIADQPRLKKQSQLLTVLLNFRFMPIALGVMILLGSGVSFAAEGALPGEMLYPVKSFNEKARVTLALSGEAKAEYESKFAVRRLEEAEKLIVKGELNDERRALIEARFEAHAEKVNERIERMRIDKKDEAAIGISADFESSLEAHSRVLDYLVDRGANGNGSSIAVKVKSRSEALTGLRESFEAFDIGQEIKIDLETSVGHRLNATEHKIIEVKSFIEKKRAKADAAVVAEAEVKIKSSEAKVAEAKVKIEAKAFIEAMSLLQEAHQTAQEAKILVAVSVDSRIERGDEDDDGRERPGPSNNIPPSNRDQNDPPTAVPVEVKAEIEARADVQVDTKVKNQIDINSNGNGQLKIGL